MAIREKDFYVPLKEYFENELSKDLGAKIKIWETHKGIPKELKNLYPNIEPVLNSLRAYFPDLVGLIGDEDKKLIIIEVKDDLLSLKDIYQTKRYSEIINADYSFLVSPCFFNKGDEQLIKNDEIEHIKNYYLKEGSEINIKRILIGKIDCDVKDGKINIKGISFDTSMDLNSK